MKRNTLIFTILLIFVIALTGCINDKSENTDDVKPDNLPDTNTEEVSNIDEADNKNKKEEESSNLSFLEDIAEPPNSIADVIQQKAGPYAGIDVNADSVIDQVLVDVRKLEPLPEDATEEQLNAYFKYLIH